MNLIESIGMFILGFLPTLAMLEVSSRTICGKKMPIVDTKN